ncbi:hypothetical protein JTB14_025840 [Gonioctena quinquepunctata]|nr:hypothetical protein JTB14_025840 [Gonioctena quinquepunctata]
MKFICGKSERQFVKRNLTEIFTNKLASVCSWRGVNGKFKLSNTAMMECLRGATEASYPKLTQRDHEVIVMKWFGNVKQRSMSEASRKGESLPARKYIEIDMQKTDKRRQRT